MTQLPDYPITRLPDLLCSTNDDRAVLGAEPKTVAQRGLDLGGAALIRNDVEIARRIGIVLIDGRREESARQRQRGGPDTCGGARALGMADHRLHRRARQAVGVIAEDLAHA